MTYDPLIETEAKEKFADVYQHLLQAGVNRNESEREAKLKKTLASVRGRVVDLCKPTQDKYETAVSVILGRNIDAIVADEEKTAIECIDVKQLSSPSTRPAPSQSTTSSAHLLEVHRLAVDVIQYEPAIERAMLHACGNALVCDTMDVVRYVCWERGQEVRAVTLAGTVIYKSGLITGGRSTHGGGKKWEKDVQGFSCLRDNLVAQLQELDHSIPRGKTDKNVIAEVTRLESAIAVIRDDLFTLSAILIPVTRCELFNKAYNHISDCIDQVYKDLTKGKASPMGGIAYLSLQDSEEPYNAGIKYHAMPLMKRFRDMEQLSGGEKTVAALPAPFFVLDEVDAALDNTNVAKIANYI
ncbi:SMCs flexible hinge [Suillus fuscotomentosus]|uniref:SMCs flexible hinge n=1 Tax=Suillus fuscotomentosus TaxID=1912939 RepID=A0AAD4DSK7_9AGAM|nr:SMCs flexible hinge [Suillus fuscotomentosus]XP_041218682.1 SMCs flexible hinge [Suillus fuscotomentosus]XP_041218885.1 SMCs flexible hinge [Suillus fuscotomentosus]KAG1893087.1 SMCs flexible hinge [Suillus fuscotomentosus]KAG1893106.1 SMCs flexible hinge [Suillus fuscotomentosus]KAG1893309.1 SMCs flexible hinge [Suillus fuscotomentosus]